MRLPFCGRKPCQEWSHTRNISILPYKGWLDTMLSWRGGFEIIPFHAMLIVTGLLLYMIGAIRRRKQF